MNGQPMLPKWPNDGSSHKIFGAVSEDLLGGTGKAEDEKLQAQELSRSCAQENVRQKKEPLLNVVKIGRLAQPVA